MEIGAIFKVCRRIHRYPEGAPLPLTASDSSESWRFVIGCRTLPLLAFIGIPTEVFASDGGPLNDAPISSVLPWAIVISAVSLFLAGLYQLSEFSLKYKELITGHGQRRRFFSIFGAAMAVIIILGVGVALHSPAGLFASMEKGTALAWACFTLGLIPMPILLLELLVIRNWRHLGAIDHYLLNVQGHPRLGPMLEWLRSQSSGRLASSSATDASELIAKAGRFVAIYWYELLQWLLLYFVAPLIGAQKIRPGMNGRVIHDPEEVRFQLTEDSLFSVGSILVVIGLSYAAAASFLPAWFNTYAANIATLIFVSLFIVAILVGGRGLKRLKVDSFKEGGLEPKNVFLRMLWLVGFAFLIDALFGGIGREGLALQLLDGSSRSELVYLITLIYIKIGGIGSLALGVLLIVLMWRLHKEVGSAWQAVALFSHQKVPARLEDKTRHRLKNLLIVARSTLEDVAEVIGDPASLEELADDDERRQIYADQCRTAIGAAKTTEALIREIGLGARLQQAKSGDIVWHKARNLFEGIAAPYQSSAHGRFRSELDVPAGVDLFIDKLLFIDMVSNLVNNALDATESVDANLPHVTLDVNYEHDGRYPLQVVVKDRGPGIPRPLRSRIYDPYYTTKTGGKGTGLGLYMVKEYIRDIGGEITLMSKTELPESGTTFTLFLPAHLTRMATARSEEPTKGGAHGS